MSIFGIGHGWNRQVGTTQESDQPVAGEGGGQSGQGTNVSTDGFDSAPTAPVQLDTPEQAPAEGEVVFEGEAGLEGVNGSATVTEGDTTTTGEVSLDGDGASASVTTTEGDTSASATASYDGETVTGSATVSDGDSSATVTAGYDGETVTGSAGLDEGAFGVDASFEISDDTRSVTVGGDVDLPKGLNISFGITASQTDNVEVGEEYTTATASTTMSVDLGGEVDLGKVSFGADYTESETVSYQLRMTNEDHALMESGEIPTPSHHDPDTMPVGSAIVMSSTDAQETGFSASYDALKLTAGVSEEESVSVAVEKTDEDTVRVTVGPSEQIENSFQLGLEFGPASVHVGNTTSLESGRLTTVEFDLSTPEGEAAYNTFLATGELPTEAGTGVSGQTVVERLDYDSTSTAGAALGPLEGSVELGSSNLSIVETTYPDGTRSVVVDAKLHSGAPVHLERYFNADGTEDTDRQVISMFFEGLGGDSEEQWAQAYGVDESLFDGDMDISLTYTAEEAMALTDQAQAYIDDWEATTGEEWDPEFMTQDMKLIDALANAETPAEVAQALIQAYGGPEWMGNAFALMGSIPGAQPLPGTIEARER